MGIPVIGCHCSVCHSGSPYNQRMRPSGLLTFRNKKYLIDCGPDFRMQALKYHIEHLDGLLLTHAHHDHTAGIDELRAYHLYSKKALPCLLSQETADDLLKRYYYIFVKKNPEALTPQLTLQILETEKGEVLFQELSVQYVSYKQGGMKVNGFRFGNFAYISDIRDYSENLFESLLGVEILVLSALRLDPSPFHFGLDEAIQFARRVGAEHTWLTHIAHDLDHETSNAYLPPNVRMAYDGLKLTF